VAREAADVAPPGPPPIAIEELSVRYGSRIALDRVALAVPPGSVYALLGRNGAGKSSLVRCLVGQQKPDRGSVRLAGRDAWRERRALMCRVGYVPEEPDCPPSMSARALERFCERLHDPWDGAGVHARLARAGIPTEVPFGRLSKGQRRLVALALALGHRPEVVVLDDPTLGLDVAARRVLFEELVGELADRGATVLVTTHDLAGIEGIADRVGILREGRLVVDEPLEALKARHADRAPALEAIFLEITESIVEVAS
jgi:ABC-2 type transport system ATP-binding protein